MKVNREPEIKVGTKLKFKEDNLIVTVESIEIVKRRGRIQSAYGVGCGVIYSENLKNWEVLE